MCEHLGKREFFRFRIYRYLIMNIALQTRVPALSEYYSETKCIWCDGCGNYGIWTAVKYALVELNLHPWQVCLCYDVGCHGNGSDKIEGYRFHGLHGRAIPFAPGAKLPTMKIPIYPLLRDRRRFSEGIRAFFPWREGHFSPPVRLPQQPK